MPAPTPKVRQNVHSPEFKRTARRYSLLIIVLGLIGGSILAWRIDIAEKSAPDPVPQHSRPATPQR